MLDCGLNTPKMAGGQDNNVPRFLNRCLGMRLSQQSDMTTYFHTALETVIKTAKQNGKYDVGIKTLTGRVVKFTSKPRVFHFRGEDAMAERLYMYSVQRDSGVDVETAKRLYDEAIAGQGESGEGATSVDDGYHDINARNGLTWISRNNKQTIKTGFYIDQGWRTNTSRGRHRYIKIPKVFLLITSDTPLMKNKVLRVRPNGKEVTHVNNVKLTHLECCKSPEKIEEALKAWEREFKAADIPSNQEYQFSCCGRHTEVKVLTGDGLVPILNKILKEFLVARRDRDGNVTGYSTLTDVIRVETGDNVGLDDDVVLVESAFEGKNSGSTTSNERNAENINPTLYQETDVTGEENVGEILARKDDKSGLVTRGLITKYKDDGHYDECSPSGSFYVKFINGKKMIMNADHVYGAK